MLTVQNKTRLCELIRIAQKQLTGQVVAAELGKAYQTWSNELSPFDESHKLGFFDALNAVMISGEFFDLLNYLANLFGYQITPQAAATKSDLNRLLMQMSKEIGDVNATFLEATNPESSCGEQICDDERAKIKQEIAEAREVLNQFEANLNGTETNSGH